MKVIAFYLPQFHEIPENNEWWGVGFTEWVNVKNAKPLYNGHIQPRIPLNKNYYDLSDVNTMKWQVDLAHEYGVYGFCFYHYWFDGHLLLQKPLDNYLKDKNLDLPFCICWANEHWTNAWVSNKDTVLIEQRYGVKKEWRDHFDYLLPYFKDERYIRVDGKPMMIIYRPELIDCLNDMLDSWQKWAKEENLKGLHFTYQHVSFYLHPNRDDSRFQSRIEYQPIYARSLKRQDKHTILRKVKREIVEYLEKHLRIDARHLLEKNKITIDDYDEMWREIINFGPSSDTAYPGAFVGWDNTPRRANGGSIIAGETPEKFEKYLEIQVRRTRDVYKKDMLFLFAWNEWAEGGYLEPDEVERFARLEAIKRALINTHELDLP